MTAAEQVAAARRVLDEWEATEQAGTQRPWQVETYGNGQRHITAGPKGYDDVIDPGDVKCGTYCQGGTSTIEMTDPDAALIAAARNAFPGLIALCRLILLDHAEGDPEEGITDLQGRQLCQVCEITWPCPDVQAVLEATGADQ